MTSATKGKRTSRTPPAPDSGKNIDLDRYIPAFLTWTSNKLSRGASQCYLKHFGVGIETWRCLVLFAIEEAISAQQVSRITGMDKGSVSRCFKSMLESGLIRIDPLREGGRMRIAVLTPKGRALHHLIRDVALERERAFLEVLSTSEVDMLLALFRRLHENLPVVEVATQRFIEQKFPSAKKTRQRAGIESD